MNIYVLVGLQRELYNPVVQMHELMHDAIMEEELKEELEELEELESFF
jgi:hypothetical protein